MEEIRQRIVVPEGMTMEELKDDVARGGRFLVFWYCISAIAFSLKLHSRSIYVPAGKSALPLIRKYNTLSFIFGWWCLGPGPKYTSRYISMNRRGGVDVTDDIMVNLDKEGLRNKICTFTKKAEWFAKPDKWDRKEMEKAIKPICERDVNIRKVVAGIYIPDELSPEGYDESFRAIGIRCTGGFPKYEATMRTLLEKRFRKRTLFRFFDLDAEDEMIKVLEKHGTVIYERKLLR